MKASRSIFVYAMSALCGYAEPSPSARILQPDEKYVADRKAIEEWAALQKTELNGRCEALSRDAGEKFKLDLTVDWKDKRIVIDLPQVAMQTQKISLDLPQAKMARRDVSFHTPSVRMVNKKVGQYPEFHGLKVRWKDMITKVPETFMQKQKMSWNEPVFAWETTSVVLNLPEITMARHEMQLPLPEVRVDDARFVVPINNSEPERKAEEIQRDAEKFRDEMQKRNERLEAEAEARQRKSNLEVQTKVAVQANGELARLRTEKLNELQKNLDQADTALRDNGGVQGATVAPEELTPLQKEREKIANSLKRTQEQFQAAEGVADIATDALLNESRTILKLTQPSPQANSSATPTGGTTPPQH